MAEAQSGYRLRAMTRSDVDWVTRVHCEAFPEFFLTQLGPRFVREFYAAQVDDPRCVALVASAEGSEEIVGAVVGTSEPHGFYRRLARTRWPRFAVAAIPLCLRSPRAAVRVVRGLGYSGSAGGYSQGALLSSICVSPRVQGAGVGKLLERGWCASMAGMGVSSGYLTTDAVGNSATLTFYRGLGWRDTTEFRTAEGRRMKLFTKSLSPAKSCDLPARRRPRVLHVVAGDAYGGASRIIFDIATSLQDRYEVHVAVSEPVLGQQLERAGVRVHPQYPIERRIAPLRDARATMRLARLIRRERFDVVHTHTSKGGVIGRLAALSARTPVRVHTIHNFAFGESTVWPLRMLNLGIERMLGRATTAVTTVSEALGEQCSSSRIATGRVTVIPNGVPDRRVEPRRGTRGRLRIVYHGRIATGKGIEELLAACATLRAEGFEFELALFGAGESQGALQSLAQEQGIDADVFKGFTVEIETVLRGADICVQPSHREGMSIALLEAMRAGRCVIASDIAPNLEVLGQPPAAVVFRCGSVEGLTESLRTALRSESVRRKTAVEARRRFEEHYRTETMNMRYLELYERLSPAPVPC